MLSGRNRCGLNLRGNNSHYGLSLYGSGGYCVESKPVQVGVVLSKDYLDFKLLVIKNYIEPLMNKEYEYLKYNYHMIDATLERIKKYGNEQNKQDIELFSKILSESELQKFYTKERYFLNETEFNDKDLESIYLIFDT